jgi:hypothetical protein
MAPRIEPHRDGKLLIIGKLPRDELLAEIAHRIGPEEQAVEVPIDVVHRFFGLPPKDEMEDGTLE